MATRATYTFKSSSGDRHIYIHWDGYPEGAARYFKNMMDLRAEQRKSLSDLRGGLTEQFIRANRGAEFTKHWEVHGDTEWHYEITGSLEAVSLKVFKLSWDDVGDRRGVAFFQGSMDDYLSLYLQNREEDENHAN